MMKALRKWFDNYRIHFLVWALFILYECTVVRVFTGENGAIAAYIVHYAVIIVYFYLYGLLGLPWALRIKRQTVWRLPVIVALEIVAFVLTYYVCDIILTHFKVKLLSGLPILNYKYCVNNTYRAIYFFAFATAYYYLKTYLGERGRVEALEREKLNEVIKRQKIEQELIRAQNAFLKAQINPHFLFNTLDFIYHNVSELSPKAADAIITLSEMMRYAIDADKMGEFICIGDELEQVQNLQYLNHLRKNDDISLKVIYSDEVRNISFIPLVLLTLTENIFKHGNLQNGQEALMELYIEDGLFVIKTDNISNRHKQNTSHHTGLVNIEQRLKYAYGDEVYFDHHQDADGHFRLTIKVPAVLLKDAAAPSPVLTGIGKV
ncbi:MAG: sensor histidine kinase [Mucilaginibacter sp.]